MSPSTRPIPIVACLAGDGIGPEVMAEAGRVIDAASELFGIRVRQVHLPFGGDAIDKHGDPFPSHVRAAVKASDAVLLGAVGGPRWDGSPVRPEAGLLGLRKELDTYANLRPVRHGAIDLMVVRELTGGLYFGKKTLEQDVASDECRYTREQIERVARWGFRLARRRGGRVVSVDKANVLSTSKLWRRVVTELHASEFEEIRLTHELVDSFAMNLATRPQDYDVVLTENLFGDILSDLAAAVGGGLGLAPSASLGSEPPGIFEPVHGSAPDIAGQGEANPIAMILSVGLMFTYGLARRDIGRTIAAAVDQVLAAGTATADQISGGRAYATWEVGQAICRALADHAHGSGEFAADPYGEAVARG
ncbi:MAG: 3-isopropylmalate dehydrogenase [Gaiellales bacterium]|jgi:3-isopropylmalate dehydrogenase